MQFVQNCKSMFLVKKMQLELAETDNRLYDITGDVTDKYDALPWRDFDDVLERQRIINFCIEFTK